MLLPIYIKTLLKKPIQAPDRLEIIKSKLQRFIQKQVKIPSRWQTDENTGDRFLDFNPAIVIYNKKIQQIRYNDTTQITSALTPDNKILILNTTTNQWK